MGEDPQPLRQITCTQVKPREKTIYITYQNQIGVNLTRYLFTGNGTTLHLPDAPHLLLHLLLLHQNIEVALLQLVLRLRVEISDGNVFNSDKDLNTET